MRLKTMLSVVALIATFAVPAATGAQQRDPSGIESADGAPSQDIGLGWSAALAHLTLTATEKQRIHDYVVQHRATTQSDGESDDPRARLADEQELVGLIQSALSPANRTKFMRIMAQQRARGH